MSLWMSKFNMVSKPNFSRLKCWSMMVGENQWIKQNVSPLWFQWEVNKLKYLWTIEGS